MGVLDSLKSRMASWLKPPTEEVWSRSQNDPVVVSVGRSFKPEDLRGYISQASSGYLAPLQSFYEEMLARDAHLKALTDTAEDYLTEASVSVLAYPSTLRRGSAASSAEAKIAHEIAFAVDQELSRPEVRLDLAIRHLASGFWRGVAGVRVVVDPTGPRERLVSLEPLPSQRFGDATTLTWTGAIDSDWNKAGNWSGNTVPTSVDTVVIPNTSNKPQLLSAVSIANLNISQGDARLDLNNFDLSVSSYITIAGTMTASGSEQIALGGNWNATGGWFNPAQSTVTFQINSTTQTILSAGTSFYHLVFTTATASTVGVLKPADPLYVLGNMKFTKGIFDNQLSSSDIKVAGNVSMNNAKTNMGASTWTVNGSFNNNAVTTFNRNTSLVVMTGQNTTLSVTSYNNRLYSVRIEGNVTGTADIEASAGVDALVVQGGTLTVSQGLDTAVYAGRVKVTSGGKLTGAGSMTFGSGVGIPTYAGTIDISTITIQANGGHTFAAGTYGTYMLFDQGWGTSITFTGDTTFTKSVYMLADISGQSFVVQNNTNNPTLTFNRNLTLAESGNGITWTKGTGQLLFSSNTANQTVNFLGKSVESVVSSNTASGGLTFISSFTTPSLYVNASGLSSAATVYFAGNSTFTISTFTVTGSAANHVVLKSTDSSQWFLSNTSSHTVAYVEVSSSEVRVRARLAN
jgi:hypothetical protein